MTIFLELELVVEAVVHEFLNYDAKFVVVVNFELVAVVKLNAPAKFDVVEAMPMTQ